MKIRAFSLVELSIVLIIIGLIVASIFIGKNIVTQAKYRNLIAELERNKYYYMEFKNQYNAIPGDIIDANIFWGASCDATASKCNGDGDGLIAYGASGDDSEGFRVWQHLFLAGISPYSLTGIGGGDFGQGALININVPKSRFGSGIGFSYGKNHAGKIVIGSAVEHDITLGAAFSPRDLYYIDLKIDDSMPSSGILQAIDGGDDICISANEYLLEETDTSACYGEYYLGGN